nr:DUF4860 domain-containing protein [bacterium]
MKKHASVHSLDIVFALLLFCAFSLSVLLVLISGSRVYQKTDSAVTQRFEERTCLSYLNARVRHADTAGSIGVGALEGVPALLIRERGMDDTVYITYLYVYEGQLMELYCQEGLSFLPQDGQAIMPAAKLEVAMAQENLLSLRCTGTNGRTFHQFIYIKSGEGHS